jgi:hypothetical protein
MLAEPLCVLHLKAPGCLDKSAVCHFRFLPFRRLTLQDFKQEHRRISCVSHHVLVIPRWFQQLKRWSSVNLERSGWNSWSTSPSERAIEQRRSHFWPAESSRYILAMRRRLHDRNSDLLRNDLGQRCETPHGPGNPLRSGVGVPDVLLLAWY